MEKKIFWVVLIFAFVCTSEAFCGPFGLDMGMSLARVRQVSKTAPENNGDDIYQVTPPNTNDMFESYVVRIHPTYGVYLIIGVGKDISTNGYGIELKTAFNSLIGSIERTYGKYKKTDYLLPRSIWNDPDDFMMGLIKSERFLYAIWETKEGSNLPNDIETIGVSASALSTSKGYLNIEYYSPNYEKVKAEKQAKQDSVF